MILEFSGKNTLGKAANSEAKRDPHRYFTLSGKFYRHQKFMVVLSLPELV